MILCGKNQVLIIAWEIIIGFISAFDSANDWALHFWRGAQCPKKHLPNVVFGCLWPLKPQAAPSALLSSSRDVSGRFDGPCIHSLCKRKRGYRQDLLSRGFSPVGKMGPLQAGVYPATSRPYQKRHLHAEPRRMLSPRAICAFTRGEGSSETPLERKLWKPWTFFLGKNACTQKSWPWRPPMHPRLSTPHIQQRSLRFCAMTKEICSVEASGRSGRSLECKIQKDNSDF